MAVDAALRDLMPQQVALTAPSGRDGHNQITYTGSGTQYQCRITGKSQTFTDTAGKTRTSTGRVTLADYVAGVTTDWRLVLPDGTRAWIYAVNQNDDETGSYNTVLYFGGQV